MSAYPDVTTGPGTGNPSLTNNVPIIPYVPVIPSSPTRSDYNSAARPVSERTLTIAGAGTLLPTILGMDQTGAKITAIIDYNGGLVLRCEWCRGGIEAVNALYMDDAVAPVGVTATHYDGSQVTPDPTLVAAYAARSRTYTDTLNGVCYSVLVVTPGLGNGFPRFVAEIKGQKIAQTSGGTPAYTDNGVWFIAWLITQRLQESINWASFTAAAAASGDVMVGSPAEKKRILGLTLDTEKSVTEWISILLGYTGCALWYDNGEWGITAETATYTAPFSVTEAMMKDGEIDVQCRNVKNAPTVVRIWYTNTSAIPWREEYAEVSMPGAGSTLPYLLSEVRMPAIQRYSHAYREAYEQLYDYQLGDLTATFITRDQGLKIMPGDVFPITHSCGFSAKPFRCTSMPEPVEAGRWKIQTREFDPAKYSTAVVTAPTFSDTSLPSPNAPPTLGALTLTEEYVVQPTGAMPISRIRATFAAVTAWPFTRGYRFIVKDINGVVVSDQDVTGNVYVSPPLPALTSYTVSGYVLSRVAQSATASTAAISLVGTGVESLATVASAAITPSGGWFIDGPEQYQLYPGDPNMRIRMDFSGNMDGIYTGSDMSYPGRNSMLLDSLRSAPFSIAISSFVAVSPTYDLGAERTGVIALLNVQDWAALYAAGMTCTIYARNTANTITSETIGYRAKVTSARYVYFAIQTIREKAGGNNYYHYNWAIEFVNSTLAMLMPTVTDNIAATSSLSASVTVQLPRRYISITAVQVTAQSGTQANPSYSNVLTSETTLSGNTLQLDVYDQTNARLAVPCSITVTGVAA